MTKTHTDRKAWRDLVIRLEKPCLVEIAGRKVAVKANGEAFGARTHYPSLIAAALERAADHRETLATLTPSGLTAEGFELVRGEMIDAHTSAIRTARFYNNAR